MEFSFSFYYVCFGLLLSTIAILRKSKRKQRHINLPPGPKKLPVIGNLHQLALDKGPLPHNTVKRLAEKHGPIMHLKLGEIDTIFVSSSEIAREVLKGSACANRPESIGSKILWYDGTDIAFSQYGDYWRQMRKICILELLSNKNVKSFTYIRQDEASRLVKSIQASCGKTMDLTDKLQLFSSSSTSRAAFGGVLKDADEIIAMMKEGTYLAGGFELADFFPSFKILNLFSFNKKKLWTFRHRLDKILDGIIEEHRVNLATNKKGNGELGGEDIVDVLIRLQESQELDIPISNDNIKAVIFDMFSAGTETSTVVTDWTMAELMRNPRVLQKAQTEIREALKGKKTFEESDIRDLKYLKFIVKESLRMHPPNTLLPRACREECEINGYTIPVKSKVLICSGALGRDPKYWDDPESFKPERFENNSVDFLGNNFEFLPFGSGKRVCPGLNFGLANVELTVAHLLYHFDWKMPPGMSPKDVDMTETLGVDVARKYPLYVVPTLYNPTV